MSFLTKYGTLWGAVPMTAGRVVWVAPSATYTVDNNSYTASDGHNGLSPEQAKLTLDGAFDSVRANVGDVIALLPGAHSWSASATWDIAGVTVMGLPYFPIPTRKGPFGKPKTSITTSAADQIINITASGATLANVTVIPVTAQTGIDYSAAADQPVFCDLWIDMRTPAGHGSTKGIAPTAATDAADNAHYMRVYIDNEHAGTSQGPAIDVGAGINQRVEDCTIANYGSVSPWLIALQMQDGSTGVLRDCDFTDILAGGITKCVTGVAMTGTNAWTGMRNYFSQNITKPFDDFGTADISIAENYIAGDGATGNNGSGGTLVILIT